MGVGINSEALWPGDRCDLAGAPFRGIGISEESEKIHKAGTPSLKKRFVEGKNMFLLDSPISGCPMDKKSSLANPNRGCKAGPKNGS